MYFSYTLHVPPGGTVYLQKLPTNMVTSQYTDFKHNTVKGHCSYILSCSYKASACNPEFCCWFLGWIWQTWQTWWAWTGRASGEQIIIIQIVFTSYLNPPKTLIYCCMIVFISGSSWIPWNSWTSWHQRTQSECFSLVTCFTKLWLLIDCMWWLTDV